MDPMSYGQMAISMVTLDFAFAAFDDLPKIALLSLSRCLLYDHLPPLTVMKASTQHLEIEGIRPENFRARDTLQFKKVESKRPFERNKQVMGFRPSPVWSAAKK